MTEVGVLIERSSESDSELSYSLIWCDVGVTRSNTEFLELTWLECFSWWIQKQTAGNTKIRRPGVNPMKCLQACITTLVNKSLNWVTCNHLCWQIQSTHTCFHIKFDYTCNYKSLLKARSTYKLVNCRIGAWVPREIVIKNKCRIFHPPMWPN